MNNEKLIGYILSDSSMMGEVKPKIIENNGKRIIFETILQEAEARNRNKRFYTKQVLLNGLNQAHIKERLLTNSWAGEAEHPMDLKIERQVRIDPSNKSHYVQKWWDDGNYIKGRIASSMTPIGKAMMDDIVENNLIVAFSLRCLAQVDKQSGMVKDPIHIICYDQVQHPSHNKAYMSNSLSENTIPVSAEDLEYVIKNDGGVLLENLNLAGFNLDRDHFSVTKQGNIIAETQGKDIKMQMSANESVHKQMVSWLTQNF